jgi:hypothetical protein
MTLLVKIDFELTLVWVNFFQGITVPVCRMAIDRDVTLFAVEQKKLGIINSLLHLVV